MKSPDERVVKISEQEAPNEGLRLARAFEKIKDPAVRQRIIAEAEKAVREQSKGAS